MEEVGVNNEKRKRDAPDRLGDFLDWQSNDVVEVLEEKVYVHEAKDVQKLLELFETGALPLATKATIYFTEMANENGQNLPKGEPSTAPLSFFLGYGEQCQHKRHDAFTHHPMVRALP